MQENQNLLAALTRAKPRIANYPFTTINPNLGVTYYKNKELLWLIYQV